MDSFFEAEDFVCSNFSIRVSIMDSLIRFFLDLLNFLIQFADKIYFTIVFYKLTNILKSHITIADSVYGSTLFVATGFHGIRLLIGTTFLLKRSFNFSILFL